jgi:triacylglycerol esterase/lipase EstA (alpha/beta hydrolase family)
MNKILMLLAALLSTDAFARQGPPAGVNNGACRPASTHPRPVVLVHGTYSNIHDNWTALAPLLQNNGWCVYALDYGVTEYSNETMFGMGPVADSAEQLAEFVGRVLAASGATQVDLVGHSQGGMMPRWYLKFLDGAPRVHALVGIAPTNHGTDTLSQWLAQVPPWANDLIGLWCPACADQLAGSPFMRKLNDGGDTVPGVQYTVIASRYDDIVTPYTSSLLQGDGVRNIVIQDLCPRHRVTHEQLAFDPVTLQLVLNALDPATARPPPCETR